MQQELKSLNSKRDLWQVREYNRKTRLPQSLVVFKVFSTKTPKDLCRKLFRSYGNGLPFDFFPVQTRVDYDYSGHTVHSEECLVFYVFTDCLPPKISIPNVLYCYRKAIDPEFKDVMYKNLIRFDGSYIQKLTLEESTEKIKVLNDLTSSYVAEREKLISL